MQAEKVFYYCIMTHTLKQLFNGKKLPLCGVLRKWKAPSLYPPPSCGRWDANP